jgi:hypothetical protein
LTYIWLIVLVFLFMLYGLYTWGVYPLKKENASAPRLIGLASAGERAGAVSMPVSVKSALMTAGMPEAFCSRTTTNGSDQLSLVPSLGQPIREGQLCQITAALVDPAV